MYSALVVDDEEIIRNGICRKLTRFFPELTVLPAQENGIEALHYISNHEVDVVLVDIKMPMVDGLEFIRRARQYRPQLLFVVISGFKNFDYAKTALTLGVREYILKPIDNDEFQEVIGKILKELELTQVMKVEESVTKTKVREGELLKKSRYLTELIRADAAIDTKELVADLEGMGVVFEDTNYIALSILTPNIKEIPEFKNVSGLSILQYAVCNVIEEVYVNCGCCAFPNYKAENGFGVILNTETVLASYFILEKANKLLELLYNIYGLELKIGLGKEVHLVSDIYKSYQQAYESMLQCNMPGNKPICVHDENNTEKNAIKLISGFDKDLLESYIKTRNEEQIRAGIAKIFKEVIQNSYDNLKITVYDIYFIVMKLLKENDKEMEIAYTMFEELEGVVSGSMSLETVQKFICDRLIEVSKMFIAGKKGNGKTLVEEIREYVEGNYSKEISLGSIAVKFFINTSYLSQVFKKEMNMKFIDYITNIRLGKAKELLLQTTLTVNEVAEAIGYSDSRYFREVFVKHMKCTPSQFRKREEK